MKSTVWVSVLLVVCGFVLALMPACAADDLRIHLKYASFDPLAGEPSVASDLRSQPAPNQNESFLIQFDGPVQDTWKQQATDAGAQLINYIPHYTFLARMTSEQAQLIRKLPHVRWVGVYHAAYKLDRKLASAQGTIKARIKAFSGTDMRRLRKELTQLGGTTSDSEADESATSLGSTLSAKNLAKIARMSDVTWIEPSAERRLMNDKARGLVNLPNMWSTLGLFGAGEIVAVCDTGLDMGTMGPISADFAGRVLQTYKLGRRSEWNDPNGHGTHVSGTILGSGVLSGSNPATHSYTNSFAGAAPEAQLIMQSVIDSSGGLGGIPDNLTNLFRPPYQDGARVHSNSWGSVVNGVYTNDSQTLDQFVWDHDDFVVVVAAGNEAVDKNADGVVDSDSISSPGTAKNCITVGASENNRTSGGYQGGYSIWNFATDPIKSDLTSNNPLGMAAFSSRGPTDDGRIKPDIVAPGTNIISCRSHLASAGTLWGAYDANYTYSGGTSMSTPLVAGVSALIREYYRKSRNHNPSAALVKATLINSATDLYPGQYGTAAFLEQPTPRPNNVEGWGRIDPSYAISPTAPHTMQFVDGTQTLTTGASLSYTYQVSANPSPLRITLVWSDAAGNPAAAQTLVNDLDLTVISPNGTVLLGNGASDHTNNVEGIDIPNPVPGNYTVIINGYNVPQGPQPFALVVTAAFGPLPPKAVISSPADGSYLSGLVTITGTAAGQGFQHYSLQYGTGATPTTWMPIGPTQTVAVQDGVLGTWDTTGLTARDYTIRLVSTGDGGTNTTQHTVHITAGNINAAKTLADGSPVSLAAKIVSGIYDGFIYIQEPNRISGIRVNYISLPANLAEGSLINTTGTLQTINGERTITNAQITTP